MRAFMAIGRRLALGVNGGGISHQRRKLVSTAAMTASSTSTSTSSGRKRIGKLKTVSDTILDSRDLVVSDSGDDDDENYDEEQEGEEEDEECASASPFHLAPQQQQQQQQRRQQHQQSRQQQLPPSRALRGSLLATQTLRAQRKSLQEIAASPTRFPLTGTFAFDASGSGSFSKEAGGQKDPSSPDPPLLLSAREVIAAVSPFVSEERLRRIRAVARARCFTVLPIVEGLFDRGNLGAVCRTAEAMGVGAVWACDISSDRYRATRGRCAAGAEKWIDVRVFGRNGGAAGGLGGARGEGSQLGVGGETRDSAGTLACLRAAKAAGFRVVVAAAGPSAVRAEDFDWAASPTAFVVGNEARGVSEEARSLCDAGEIMVPMVGMVESLNVSVASACIMQAALAGIRRGRGGGGGGESSLASRSPLSDDGGGDADDEDREREVEALAAAMLLRHKGQQGKVGALWQAPMMRAILERRDGGAGGGER